MLHKFEPSGYISPETDVPDVQTSDREPMVVLGMTDEQRRMRLELLQKLYGRLCEVYPVNDGELVARAEYHHKDDEFYGISSMNMWGLQDHEIVYIFSGSRLDSEGYHTAMERSIVETGDQIKPNKKLRSATVTTLLIYDSVDDDVRREISRHDDKTYHKLSLNGWSIHRVAAVITDERAVLTDRRGKDLVRRLTRIAEI